MQYKPRKWHQWSLRGGFLLMTFISVDICCLTVINRSVVGIFETFYLVTIGWDEFAYSTFPCVSHKPGSHGTPSS